MKLLVMALKVVAFPISICATLVAVPIHLIGTYICRQHCPKCGKRNLTGSMAREENGTGLYHFGFCTRCNSGFRLRDGNWEYVDRF